MDRWYYLVLVSAVVLAASVAVSAYDFQDAYYNQILARDLEDIEDTIDVFSNPRVRREDNLLRAGSSDKCKGRKKGCCEVEYTKNNEEEIRSIKKQCHKQVAAKEKDSQSSEPALPVDPFNCDRIQKLRQHTLCVMQCVGQKQNLVDKSGGILEDEFKDYVTSNYEESWLDTESIVTQCLSEIKEMTAKRDPNECHPAALTASYCLFREVQMRCPAEEITDQKSCQRFRDKVKKFGDGGQIGALRDHVEDHEEHDKEE